MKILLICVGLVAGAMGHLLAQTGASPIVAVVPAPPPRPGPLRPSAPGLLPVPVDGLPASSPRLEATGVEDGNTASSPGTGLRFNLPQAEAYALANHPRIAGARLTAESVRQQITEARSQFFPQIYLQSDS